MIPDALRWLWSVESIITGQEFFGPFWEPVFRAFSVLAESVLVLFGITALFWLRGRRVAFAVLVAAMLSAAIVNGLKFAVDVPRPVHPDLIPYETRVSPAFPSGHAMYGVAFWGLLAWFGLLRIPFAVAIAVGVMLSRVFLGIHYPIDVIAGALIGLMGIGIGLFTYHTLFPRWSNRNLSTILSVALFGSVVMIPVADEFPFGWEIFGALIGAGIATLIESRRIDYDPMPGTLAQLLVRLAVGAAGTAVLLLFGYLLRQADAAAILRVLAMLPLGLWVLWLTPLILDRLGHNPRGRRIANSSSTDRPR